MLYPVPPPHYLTVQTQSMIPTTTTTTISLHLFNCLFSRTTWKSRYQKGKTSLDLNEAKDNGGLGMQWHQLDHMQTICILLHTDNHTIRPDDLPDAQPTVSKHVRHNSP